MALYIVLENKAPGFDPFVNGKVLGQSENRLAEIAGRLGVRPLMEFFSINPDESREFLNSEGLSDIEVPGEQWFSAEDGLHTVRTILREVKNLTDLEAVKADLLEFESVLQQAQAKGIRWHLAVDL